MRVHFTGSESNLAHQKEDYRRIVNLIKSEGHEVVIDWLEEAIAWSERIKEDKDTDKRDWSDIHKRTLDAINKSDLIIAEATTKSFSVGFQTAICLNLKKPILVITRNDSLRNSFGSGILSDLLQYSVYDDSSLESIIKSFLKVNEHTGSDLRFNFYIDNEIYNYLRWASFKYGKTRAEIIRAMLKERMEKDSHF